jgi:hypothetical protein
MLNISGRDDAARWGPDRALLRQVVALAHAVPGAELRLRTAHGAVVSVGRHPSHDLTPCQARAALLVATDPEAPDCYRSVVDAELAGSVHDTGGGLLALDGGDREVRWFATCLHPNDVVHVALADRGVPGDAIEAAVTPDAQLGAAVVRVSVENWLYGNELDRVARELLAACMVEELCRQALGAVAPAPLPEDRRRRS